MISAPDVATSGMLVSYAKHSEDACIKNKTTIYTWVCKIKVFCSAIEPFSVWPYIDKIEALISKSNNTAPVMGQ